MKGLEEWEGVSQSLENSHSSLHKHNRKWESVGGEVGRGRGSGLWNVGVSGLAPLLSTELHRRPRREEPGSQPHSIYQVLKVLGEH